MRLMRWLVGLVRPAVRREIFRYWDGRTYRYVDPLRVLGRLDERGEWRDFVQRAVLATTVDPATVPPNLAAQFADKPKLIGDLAAVVREVFGVPELDSHAGRPVGLTDVECVAVLSDFLVWCAVTSEAYRPLAKSPARPAPSPKDSDTGEFVACTSTDT